MRILAWPAISDQNAYISLLYSNMELLGAEVTHFSAQAMLEGEYSLENYDLWHIHWPDHHFSTRNPLKAARASANVLSWFREAKAKNVKLVWTVHNLRPHEKHHPYLEPIFYQSFTKMLDGWITLSQVVEHSAKQKFRPLRGKPSFVIPHGHYRDAHANDASKSSARKSLGLSDDAVVLLNFGQIRQYKNVPHLIRTFRKLADENHVLLVAGEPHTQSIEKEIVEAAQGDSRIRLELNFIPDSALPTYFAAADLVVLPYSAITQSGSAVLALSFNRPVLLPNLGALGELQSYVGDNWVRLFEGKLAVGDLQAAITWAKGASHKTVDLEALSWNSIAEKTLRGFETIVG